jgi:hypothetical protein
MNVLSNGIKIEVIMTGVVFHTLKDWGMAIGNNNYIGEPEQETYYIDVPGTNAFLDMSEALTGEPVYKSRPINVTLGGLRPRMKWDHIVSDVRNKVHGRECKIIFDNDIDHYWIGRVYIEGFDRVRELGTLQLNIPKAEPYKYDLQSSSERWLWDSFSFEHGVIRTIGTLVVNGEYRQLIPKGTMLTVPIFMVSNIASSEFTVSDGQRVFLLINGRNRFPKLKVCGADDVILVFRGRGTVVIDYRGGSL